jgi:hypothetical protein
MAVYGEGYGDDCGRDDGLSYRVRPIACAMAVGRRRIQSPSLSAAGRRPSQLLGHPKLEGFLCGVLFLADVDVGKLAVEGLS